MPQIVFPEFRDTTSSIKYPFIDAASLTSNGANGMEKITLPNDIFIDVSIFIPLEVGAWPRLESIHVGKHTVILRFGFGGDQTWCQGSITLLQDIKDEDATIPLYLSTKEEVTNVAKNTTTRVGTLVMNRLKLAYFKGLNLGTYIFNPGTDAVLVPSCTVTIPNLGVTSVSVNERSLVNTVSGKVWLIGHDGVLIRTDDNDEHRIRIDVVGDNLYKKAALGVEVYEYAKPVRSINNVPADEFGGFIITTTGSNDALRVNTDSDGITMFMAGAINGD